MIGALEDAKDYKAFEAAVIADYDAQSAVERELALRIARSAKWSWLKAWAMKIARHRGMKKAIVAHMG